MPVNDEHRVAEQQRILNASAERASRNQLTFNCFEQN
jgi:hypothetical protein